MEEVVLGLGEKSLTLLGADQGLALASPLPPRTSEDLVLGTALALCSP